MNCGRQLPEGAKFCANCGKPTYETTSTFQRRTVYEGKIFKCPCCGEIMQSFTGACPVCGYELRGSKVAESVDDFVKKLSAAYSSSQRSLLIRNFPIPNVKEDLIEFLILASTNISNESNTEIFDAWVVKFEQCYQKAKLMFSADDVFTDIQALYEKSFKRIRRINTIRSIRKYMSQISKVAVKNLPFLPSIILCTAWIISILVLIPLCPDSDYIIFCFMDLIAGAIIIPYVIKKDDIISRLIIIIGQIISIAVLIPICDQDDYPIILSTDIIVFIVLVIRLFKNKKSSK